MTVLVGHPKSSINFTRWLRISHTLGLSLDYTAIRWNRLR
jgi:hypothetical protein